MVNIEQFFQLVERYAAVKGLSESTVSLRLFNDGQRLKIMRDGGDLGLRKTAAAVQQMSDDWPEGVAWPKGIKRPRTKVQ